ncbi:MAG: sigma factor-like helix-turn-helix DNA-binding protein [Balneolaceae bacterium]
MANKGDKGKKKEQMTSSEFESAVLHAIDSLPEQIQRVYKLHRKDGLTYGEIAFIMEIPPETVELQMSVALKTLRQYLQLFPKTKD